MKNKNILLLCISFFLFGTAEAKINSIGGKNFSTIEIKYEETPNITLGQTIRIGIVATTDKGKEFKTPGFLLPGILKTVDWSEFTIEVEGGTFYDGTVTIGTNLSAIPNYEVKIKASSVNNPEVKNELTITLNFKGTTIAAFDGTKGKRGKQGQRGAKGANAITSTDDAGNAGMGGMGGQGGNGGVGQNIEVYVKLQNDAILKKDMLYVFVKSKTTGQQVLYLVDPDGGKIIVSANGGEGGDGGEGGQGGTGGDDTYKQYSTNGGQGGQGGAGGNGNDGGTITAYMDPSADKINSDVIKFSNEGGTAGEGGSGGGAGFKGYYGNATNGSIGTSGTSGQGGNKGPEIKIIKQKVDVKMEPTAGTSQSSGDDSSSETSDDNSSSSTSSTTSSGTSSTATSKPKNINGAQVKVIPSNTSGMSEYEKNKENGNGPYKYFDDGKVIQEGNYKNGEQVGLWTSYHLDGTLDSKYYYTNGEADSLFLYESTGKFVTTASRFKNGNKNGRQEEFYDNGKLRTLETYKDGTREGKAAQYNEDGSIYFEGNYKDGNKQGLWKEDDSGDLAEGNYKDDQRDGTWTIKDRKTKAVIRTEKYVNGELQN